MQKNERYFLNGMVRSIKPRKVLEVGVFNGGGSSIILNAISDVDEARLYSLEYVEKSYTDPNKPSGFLVGEKFPQFLDKWQIFRGGDASRHIEEVGGDIDLLVLDTVHIHPWETLNFLCILPFMKLSGSYTILHDITLEYAGMKSRNHLACRYLFSHVVSDEKFSPKPDREGLPSNIGAFKVSEVTMRYANNLFESLLIPWESKVLPEDLETISAIIRKYYSPEQYRFFCDAVSFQEYLEKRKNSESSMSFRDAVRFGIRSWNPSLYSFLRKVRHPFRKY